MILQSFEKEHTDFLFSYSRFLKRGVNEEGCVANDVETEQIVISDVPDGSTQISSVVQHRGSIPLFWSQQTSRFNVKPDIICTLSRLCSSFDYSYVTICFADYFNSFSVQEGSKVWRNQASLWESRKEIWASNYNLKFDQGVFHIK